MRTSRRPSLMFASVKTAADPEAPEGGGKPFLQVVKHDEFKAQVHREIANQKV